MSDDAAPDLTHRRMKNKRKNVRLKSMLYGDTSHGISAY